MSISIVFIVAAIIRVSLLGYTDKKQKKPFSDCSIERSEKGF